MPVQDVSTLATVTLPRQAGPLDLARTPTAPSAGPAPVAPVGRDRPLTAEEREFAVGLAAVFGVLLAFIVAALVLARYVWT